MAEIEYANEVRKEGRAQAFVKRIKAAQKRGFHPIGPFGEAELSRFELGLKVEERTSFEPKQPKTEPAPERKATPAEVYKARIMQLDDKELKFVFV
jgi:hypothetical protein